MPLRYSFEGPLFIKLTSHFHLFPALPVELRHLVYTFALLNHPRTLHLSWHCQNADLDETVKGAPRQEAHPPLLQISHESRVFALMHYTLQISWYIGFKKSFYFCPEIDTLSASRHAILGHPSLDLDGLAYQVKFMVFTTDLYQFPYKFFRSLMSFERLKDIKIIFKREKYDDDDDDNKWKKMIASVQEGPLEESKVLFPGCNITLAKGGVTQDEDAVVAERDPQNHWKTFPHKN